MRVQTVPVEVKRRIRLGTSWRAWCSLTSIRLAEIRIVRAPITLLVAMALTFATAQGIASASPQAPPRTPGASGGGDVSASPAGNRGQSIFAEHCAFCHGANGRGTGVAPDLTQTPIVHQDNGTGQVLAKFLKQGKPNFGMPAFPSLTGSQVDAIARFLHAQTLAAAHTPKLSILVGNPVAGKKYFAAHCGSCHKVSGNLKEIARRLDPMTLQARIVNPRAQGSLDAPPPESIPIAVTIRPRNGAPVSGQLLSESDFYITIRTRSGRRRTFRRNGDEPSVQIHDPLEAHMKLMRTISDSDLHDVTAYLESLK
jgi:cytochrome c oxidase cbb3-type subunit 3